MKSTTKANTKIVTGPGLNFGSPWLIKRGGK